MKQILILLIFSGLISCEKKEIKSIQYNSKAIEINNKAVKLMINHKLDSALILYDKAIKLDDKYYLPHSNKIGIYLELKEYDKALLESELVIKKKPDLAEGWFFSGLLNEKQGNIDKSITYYKKSIEIFTNRINNSEKENDINANKLNRALSKKFIDDKSYIEDFQDLKKFKNYDFFVNNFMNKSKKDIMNNFLN